MGMPKRSNNASAVIPACLRQAGESSPTGMQVVEPRQEQAAEEGDNGVPQEISDSIRASLYNAARDEPPASQKKHD